MALMKFREGNKVKWVGSRPAHRGTQIAVSVKDVVNTTVDLYQVGDGETAFITLAYLTCSLHTGDSFLYYTTSGNVVIATLIRVRTATPIYTPGVVEHFWPPLELISQQKLRVKSANAGFWVDGFCFGWVE